jgi:hypothetical protein
MSLVDALLLDPYKFHVWISPRTDGGTAQRGSGTLADPYQVATSTDFDSLINGLADNITVHLGPTPSGSPFLTKGYADGVAGGWTAKKGMRILGSGADATILKLEGGATTGKLYFAVGHPFGSTAQVDFFEISDLTISCTTLWRIAALSPSPAEREEISGPAAAVPGLRAIAALTEALV